MAKRDGSVSAAIRAYVTEHPNERTKDIAAVLSKQLGKDVAPSYVSIIRGKAKKAGKRRGRKKGMKIAVSSGGKVPSNGSIGILKSAVAFAKECGGMKQAIDLLTELQVIIGGSN
jgi:hypothetical protein